MRAYEVLGDEDRRADYDRHGHREQNALDEVRARARATATARATARVRVFWSQETKCGGRG